MKKLRSLLICLMFSFLVCAGGRTFFHSTNNSVVSVCAENPFDDVGNVD